LSSFGSPARGVISLASRSTGRQRAGTETENEDDMLAEVEPVGLTLPSGEPVPPTKLALDEEYSRSEKDELRVNERP
jgi:hypothetical protein